MSATILFVDDDDALLMFLERAIKQAGVDIFLRHVPSGEKAVEYLSGSGPYSDVSQFPLPTLILLDIKMPCLNGFDVLKWKGNRADLKSIPVVMFSSSDLPEDKQKAFALGAIDYLVKPMGSEELVVIVKRLWNYCLQRESQGQRTKDGRDPKQVLREP
jgi:DNA-binding response OmpR family regulator